MPEVFDWDLRTDFALEPQQAQGLVSVISAVSAVSTFACIRQRSTALEMNSGLLSIRRHESARRLTPAGRIADASDSCVLVSCMAGVN